MMIIHKANTMGGVISFAKQIQHHNTPHAIFLITREALLQKNEMSLNQGNMV